MPESLSQAERLVLDALASVPSGWTCGSLGSHVWGGHRGTMCSAPHARTAGKVLRRLRARGLADYWADRDEGRRVKWRIMPAGRAALAAPTG